MRSCFVRRSSTLAAFGAAVVLVGCGPDARVESLDTGMSRSAVIDSISKDAPRGTGPDSMPNVHWRETYLIAGKNYEVLYFHPDGKKVKLGDTLYAEVEPIVMVENKMVGKGWEYWDSVSTANKIPLKNREEKKKDG